MPKRFDERNSADDHENSLVFPESVPERFAWSKAASGERTAAGQAARAADGARHFGKARWPAGCRRTDSSNERGLAQP